VWSVICDAADSRPRRDSHASTRGARLAGGKVIDLLLSGERGRMREAMLDIAARRRCGRALGVVAA